MLTLFRVTTGDNGYGLVKDMTRAPPQCDDTMGCLQNCCVPGGWFSSVFYFVTYSVMSKLVLINVVVAILMVQLNDANEEVLLDAISSQSAKLDDLEGEELLKKLGLEAESLDTELESDLMKEKRENDEREANKPKWEIDKTVKKAGMQE